MELETRSGQLGHWTMAGWSINKCVPTAPRERGETHLLKQMNTILYVFKYIL